MKRTRPDLQEPSPPTLREGEIVAEGLTKSFGHFMALRGVDLDLPRGCFLIIMGPNGAGKTTLLRILATLARPTSGRVLLAGLDLRREGVEARRLLGVVLHQTLLYDELTAEQNLRFYGRLYSVPDLEARIQEVAQAVGLAHRLGDPVRTFSRGMQQRLAIARAVIHDPRSRAENPQIRVPARSSQRDFGPKHLGKGLSGWTSSIMLLDEPDTGLDVEAAARLKGILRGRPGAQRTILMTTHNLERGLQICDRVAIMHRGRIVYQGEGGIGMASFQGIYYEHTGLRDSWTS